MRFEWDPVKALKNKKKHAISFKIAITVFDDPFALIAPDPKHSLQENREWIIDQADTGILVVVFTKREEGKVYRIISARPASREERKQYAKYKNLSL